MTQATKVELRCISRRHGIIKTYPNGKRLFEVRCKDHWCADRADGVVVVHYFDWDTGELDHTKKFRDPVNNGLRAGSSKNNGMNER